MADNFNYMSKLVVGIVLFWSLFGKPYVTTDGQKYDSLKPKADTEIKSKVDPNILVIKEEKKKKKFDTAFALQEQIIANLKRSKPQPKVKYIPVPIYKTIAVYVPIKDSIVYANSRFNDTLLMGSYLDSLPRLEYKIVKPRRNIFQFIGDLFKFKSKKK